MAKRYLLVADEMGTPGMAPGTSNSFVLGGYVVGESQIHQAIRLWRNIKVQLCGAANLELKWKHFFVDADNSSIDSPLLEKNPLVRRILAANALDQLFQKAPLIPAVAVAQKDRASESFTVKSRRGKPKVDLDVMWMGPVALFAAFLHARRARGKLWFDQLGSEKQQLHWQSDWSQQLRMVRDGTFHPAFRDNLRKLLAIDEEIEFFDSRCNEAVQIADFVCGVIWQAAEGDEAFLARLVSQYGPNASRQGLGILHLE